MDMKRKHYRGLAIMSLLSFAAMYMLMYAMVDEFGNVYSSVNQAYMAGLMAAPMVLIELLVMREMYRDKRANVAIIGLSVLILATCFFFIRVQLAVSDRQFLRSMIPHHAAAILMCERATVHDPEITNLCKEIVSGQRAEIEQMRAKLRALGD